jgi:hypothetical protein
VRRDFDFGFCEFVARFGKQKKKVWGKPKQKN